MLEAIGYKPLCIPSMDPYVEPAGYKPVQNVEPEITAKSYIVLDPVKSRPLKALNDKVSREIASLTKIMTCIVSLKLAEELKLDLNQEYFRVSPYAASMNGTTAGLIEGQEVLLIDLLYGLMLPSGNDAAVCLAEGFTRLIQRFQPFKKKDSFKVNLQTMTKQKVPAPKKSYTYSLFIQRMNEHAEMLGLKSTQYTNPHGLADP